MVAVTAIYSGSDSGPATPEKCIERPRRSTLGPQKRPSQYTQHGWVFLLRNVLRQELREAFGYLQWTGSSGMAKTKRGRIRIGSEWRVDRPRGPVRAKKTGKSKAKMKRAAKRAGPSRKKGRERFRLDNLRLDRTSLRLAHLVDHLVSAGEQHRRHREAERLRGLEVDHELQLGGRLYW
jgi:hypothetical protein